MFKFSFETSKFSIKTLFLFMDGMYSVLHHALPNVSAQFIYVDQHWWEQQQVLVKSSFLCQPSHSLWGAEIYPSNHWVRCKAGPGHQPISGHSPFTLTQIQFRVSNQCVFGLWENIGKVKNPLTHGKTSELHSERLQDFWNLWGN